MQLEFGLTLSLPRGTPDMAPLVLSLEEISVIEKRMQEVSYVNKETAPELMHVFNQGYCHVSKMMAQVSWEYSQALKYLNKRKAIITLDVAPDVLTKKGLTTSRSPGGSEDLRKAVVDSDDEYLKLLDIVNALEAAYELLKGKAKGFEQAYQATKKVFDVTNGGLGSYHNLRDNQSSSVNNEEWLGKPRY